MALFFLAAVRPFAWLPVAGRTGAGGLVRWLTRTGTALAASAFEDALASSFAAGGAAGDRDLALPCPVQIQLLLSGPETQFQPSPAPTHAVAASSRIGQAKRTRFL